MTQEQEEPLARLRSLMQEREMDGLVVSAPSNVFYLSGFRGSSGALLITSSHAALFSDFRYRLQAKEQSSSFEFVEVKRHVIPGAGAAATSLGLRRVGYDAAHLTCEQFERLAQAAQGISFSSAPGLIEELRLSKSPAEVERIRAAARLADGALSHMLQFLRPGARERDVALEGEFFIRRNGGEPLPFDVIVASGPRSALPHAEPTDRELQAGDIVVIDIGARVNGYCSDMTRSFGVQAASSQAREIYELVYRAQRAGQEALRVGVSCGEVDAVARSVIQDAGHGDAFGHGLGHGVGIDVHEAPRLARGEETLLAPGHVVTVEPAVYLPGFGGVRLENLLVAGQDGAETMTGFPMDPEMPVV